MDTALFWVILAVSLVGTGFCWWRVIRAQDLLFFKIAGFVISTIPILGPIFFVLLDMPSSLPEDARAEFRPTVGTGTPHDRAAQALFQAYKKHLNRIHARAGTLKPKQEQNDGHVTNFRGRRRISKHQVREIDH